MRRVIYCDPSDIPAVKANTNILNGASKWIENQHTGSIPILLGNLTAVFVSAPLVNRIQ